MAGSFNPLTFTGTSSDLGGLNLSGISGFNGSTSFPFLENQTGMSGAGGMTGITGMTGASGNSSGLSTFNDLGSLVGNQLGSQGVQDALGNTSSSSASPMSQIFTAIDNFFQRAGFIALGIILIAIGAFFLARPQVEASVRTAKKLAA